MNKNAESLCMPIRAEPYEHQQKAFDFACQKFGLLDGIKTSDGVAFLMDMGTGKTITTIAVAGILYQTKKIETVLIIAPLSILPVWEKEFEKFADFPYEMHVLTGTMAQKKQQTVFRETDKLKIIIVNYETVWRMEQELTAFHANLIIADEGHKIKENRSKQSKAVQHLGDRAEYKLLLTGTVITNKEIDVFSQYRFLNRHIFGTAFFVFRNHYFDMVGYGNYTPKFKESKMPDFLEKMHSIAFRVTKQECLDLPEITEEIRIVELEPDAMRMYRKLERESYLEIEQSEITAANVLTKLLRLSQLTGGNLNDDDGNRKNIGKAKLNALEDIIDSIMQTSQKLVVMARFVPEEVSKSKATILFLPIYSRISFTLVTLLYSGSMFLTHFPRECRRHGVCGFRLMLNFCFADDFACFRVNDDVSFIVAVFLHQRFRQHIGNQALHLTGKS